MHMDFGSGDKMLLLGTCTKEWSLFLKVSNTLTYTHSDGPPREMESGSILARHRDFDVAVRLLRTTLCRHTHSASKSFLTGANLADKTAVDLDKEVQRSRNELTYLTHLNTPLKSTMTYGVAIEAVCTVDHS